MTALVGILCKDGVVIGSDSSATFGPHPQFHTIEQRVKKICIIEDRIIVAGTGEIGLGQRFCETVRQQWQKMPFRDQLPMQIAKEFCKGGIDDFAHTKAQQGTYGAMVAFPTKGNKFHLCEFSLLNFQPELKTGDMWFTSMGSGQPITDPFLALLKRVFWREVQPLVDEGVFAASWTLQHVIELNPGGINGPPQIAVLQPLSEKDPQLRARLLDDAAISEHLDNVTAAEKHLGNYKESLKSRGKPIPNPPPNIPVISQEKL
ncbi:MAG: hypothetical protein ABSA83_19015 [Verrucomicrobiota bacterium]